MTFATLPIYARAMTRTHNTFSFSVFAIGAGFIVGCGGETTTPMADASVDRGVDVNVTDSARPDTAQPDAATQDSATQDATVQDATANDSARQDAAADVATDVNPDTACDRDIFYRDGDSDTYGDPTQSMLACVQPIGYVTNNTDCLDSSSAAHPGASEICDGIDNDCDGQIDTGVQCTPRYAWSVASGSANLEAVKGAAFDAQGNLYVVGDVSAGQMVGTRTFPTVAGYVDVVVASFGPSGVYRWSKLIAAPGLDSAQDLVIDESGNLYVSLWAQPALPPALPSFTIEGLTAPVNFLGNQDGCVVSFTSSGDYRWHALTGTDGYDGSGKLAYADGRLLVSGWASDATSQNVLFGLRDANTGSELWRRGIGGDAGSDNSILAAAGAGVFYVGGNFTAELSLGNDTITSTGNADAWIAAINAQGTTQWLRGVGGVDGDYASALAVNPMTNDITLAIIAAGAVTSLTPTPTALGGPDAVLVRYNTGGIVQSSSAEGGDGVDNINDIKFRANGNMIIAGAAGRTFDMVGAHFVAFGNQTIGFAVERSSLGVVSQRAFDPHSPNQNAAVYSIATSRLGLTTFAGTIPGGYDFSTDMATGAMPEFGNWLVVSYRPGT